MAYPSSTWLIYGDPGSGKSHFAATFPKPMLVFCMDPRAKAMPYLKRGKLGEMQRYADGTPYQSVLHPKDAEKELVRVEYYQDTDLKGGNKTVYAYERFEERLLSLTEEVENGEWATVVLDSLSFLEYQVRKLHQYKLNSTSKDRRQWYDASSDALEEICYARLTWLPVNVVVLAHVADTKAKIGDKIAYTVDAPGFKGRKLPGAFAEVYVIHASGDGERIVQTENDTNFIATSQIMAPNGCQPHYKALWSNWDAQNNQESD